MIGGLIENHPRLYIIRHIIIAYCIGLALFLYSETVFQRSAILDRWSVRLVFILFAIYFILSLALPWDPKEANFGDTERGRIDRAIIRRLIFFSIMFLIRKY